MSDRPDDHPAPPIDPGLVRPWTAFKDLAFGGEEPTVALDTLSVVRGLGSPTVEELVGGRPVVHTEHRITSRDGTEVVLSAFARTDHSTPGIGLLHLHGGGIVFGDRLSDIAPVIDWVEDYDLVAVGVEYRLAPEHPFPAAHDDAWAALVWMSGHAAELGFDPARLAVVGGSAGGGLSAALALRARDENGPDLAGQMLVCPMLDDRNDTISSHQVLGFGPWNHESNENAWDMILGDRRGGDVSPYAAPARAEDLAGLAPAYVDVGSVDVFRDEDVAYATRIWQAGGEAELHVWPGAYHGFDGIAPDHPMAHQAGATRRRWLERVLGAEPRPD